MISNKEASVLNPILDNISEKNRLAVKDIFHFKGYPTTGGSRPLMNHVSLFTATIIRALSHWKVVSKDNLDEMAIGDSGNSTLGGKVKYSTWEEIGGSSTGTIINLEQGWAELGLGSDTGGSVRDVVFNSKIFFAFKPSWGILSRYGMFSYCNPLDTVSLIGKIETLKEALLILSKKDHRSGDATAKVLSIKKIDNFKPKLFNPPLKMKVEICRCYFNLVSVYCYSNLQRYWNKKFNSSSWWFEPSDKEPLFNPVIRKRYFFGWALLRSANGLSKTFKLRSYFRRFFNLLVHNVGCIETPVRDSLTSKEMRNWGLEIANLAGLPALARGNRSLTSFVGSEFLLLDQVWE